MCHLISVLVVIIIPYHPIIQQFFITWMYKRICDSTSLSRHIRFHNKEWTILYHLEKIHALNKL